MLGVLMDNNIFNYDAIISNGIPYDDITWQDIPGNPFGRARNFNAIIFGDANNIVDVSGAVAVGGSFYSPRGLSLSFGNNVASPEYTPELIGFLVGENVAMKGSLVVVGHVVVGGGFNAARGSTFLIGKDGMPDQIDELNFLYQAKGQSPYLSPSDRGSDYIISRYDVGRFIPASRIDANLPRFFQDAKSSITNYKECIEDLPVNGSVEENFHEWVLMGSDPDLNVFLLDRRPNGLINKGIRAEVPEGSTTILRLRTGANAHLQYGLIGDEEQASHTLYVFEDATNIYMEVPAAIWGSFLAPQAMLHGHRTGGHISGNLALNSFAVNANSGFEFHFIPFMGSVYCEGLSEVSPIAPTPEAPILPAPEPLPQPPEIPIPEPVVPLPGLEPVLPVPEEPELEFVIPIPEVPEPELPPIPEAPEPELAPIPETPPPLHAAPPLQPPIMTPTRPPRPVRPPGPVLPPPPAPTPISPVRPQPRPVLPAPEIA